MSSRTILLKKDSFRVKCDQFTCKNCQNRVIDCICNYPRLFVIRNLIPVKEYGIQIKCQFCKKSNLKNYCGYSQHVKQSHNTERGFEIQSVLEKIEYESDQLCRRYFS